MYTIDNQIIIFEKGYLFPGGSIKWERSIGMVSRGSGLPVYTLPGISPGRFLSEPMSPIRALLPITKEMNYAKNIRKNNQ